MAPKTGKQVITIRILPNISRSKGSHNPGQNIWYKKEKSSKTGQEKKSLISTFACFRQQPTRGVFRKRCYENMQQIYRRATMLKCDFNKVALQPY